MFKFFKRNYKIRTIRAETLDINDWLIYNNAPRQIAFKAINDEQVDVVLVPTNDLRTKLPSMRVIFPRRQLIRVARMK